MNQYPPSGQPPHQPPPYPPVTHQPPAAPCYRCGQPWAAHNQGFCPPPPLPVRRLPARRPRGRDLWIIAAVLLAVLLIPLGQWVSAGAGRHHAAVPTYQQGASYATRYMRAGGPVRLVVPESSLPRVCQGIARSNPYGVPGAPGANPGRAWIRGCIAGIEAAPNFAPAY